MTSTMPSEWRQKRSSSWRTDIDPTYIDAIGVPRGVPDEYKIADQVAAGFESLFCWWCTINKNVDRINYIHYNVQKLGNWTQSGFEAVHGQLSSTSLMAFQNRIALDMLLAEKGGVCAMFREQCCTFIPNNTAADGSLTKAIDGLKTLNAISPMEDRFTQMYPLLQQNRDNDDNTDEESDHWPDLFPDPGDYESPPNGTLLSHDWQGRLTPNQDSLTVAPKAALTR
ncbi:uncharacterized protein LOC122876512 [Siniperca chuatsi]|uniref:uncharacterized protein LOC122876512 n=1 Tax=Siniperca chuatsi TaxID=119488 RepID=UPI001CE220A3|nr:uncharacterized protein LOC122876512 [Siniperca chuatsi]